jgi:hypothetical protein
MIATCNTLNRIVIAAGQIVIASDGVIATGLRTFCGK